MPEVASFEFLTYPSRTSALEEIDKLLNPALAALPRTPLPSFDEDVEPFPEESFDQVVELLLRHGKDRPGVTLTAEAVASETPFPTHIPLLPGHVLALTSRCRLRDGRVAHLAMLDLRCRPTDYFLRLAKAGLRRILEGGALVRSGRSFHCYGFRPLDEGAWRRFMAQALLLAPLTDVRYIAHRLLDGVAALRLTSSALKPTTPVVADYLRDDPGISVRPYG
jgi:hypothetical protein